MRSPRRALIEQILQDDGAYSERYVDLGARLRVVRRAEGERFGADAELLEKVYGGRYDTWMGRYVGPPEKVHELRAHEGQLPLLLFDDPAVSRVLAIGAAGAGKTMAIVLRAILSVLEHPNAYSGIVAPTHQRLQVVWNKLLGLVGPLGWVAYVRVADSEIGFKNGHAIQFVSAKKSSNQTGNAIAGRDWVVANEDEQQNIDDDALIEVDMRGRVAGLSYRVYSSATNQLIPQFQRRLEEYKRNPQKQILRFAGRTNAFIDPAFYERQRGNMSDEQWRRLVEAEEVPLVGAIYPRFSYKDSIRPLPTVAKDVTGSLLFAELEAVPEKGGQPFEYVVGHDWGSRFQASVILKAFLDPETGERLWWAIDEILTDGAGPDGHAQEILKRYGKRGVVIGDPHLVKRADGAAKTDYDVFRKHGLTVYKAASRIDLRHRFAMVNALLEDTTKKRRLFVASDSTGHPKCPHLVESFKMYKYGASGEPEQYDKKTGDVSHATDALGYGLFRFEKIRGQDLFSGGSVEAQPPADAWWLK